MKLQTAMVAAKGIYLPKLACPIVLSAQVAHGAPIYPLALHGFWLRLRVSLGLSFAMGLHEVEYAHTTRDPDLRTDYWRAGSWIENGIEPGTESFHGSGRFRKIHLLGMCVVRQRGARPLKKLKFLRIPVFSCFFHYTCYRVIL